MKSLKRVLRLNSERKNMATVCVSAFGGMGFANFAEKNNMGFWAIYAIFAFVALVAAAHYLLSSAVKRQAKAVLLITVGTFVAASVIFPFLPGTIGEWWPDFCSLVFTWSILWIGAVTLLLCPVLAWVGLCAALWLTSPLIEPAGSSHMALGVICVLAWRYFRKARSSDQIKPYFRGILFGGTILLSFVAAFCLFGYRLFLSGDFIDTSRRKIVYFLLGAIWTYPVIVSVLYGLEHIRNAVRNAKAGDTNRAAADRSRVAVITTLCFMCVMLVSWCAYYPGGYPSDAVWQMTMAHNNHYVAWHSVLHTLIIKAVLTVWNNEAAVVLFQMFMFSVLIGKTALLAYDIGIKAEAIYIGAMVFGLLPNQFTTIISPQKDFGFTYACLWLTLLLIDLAKDEACIKKPGYIVCLALAMFFTYALRNNGIAPMLFVMALLLILTVKFWKTIKHYACASVLLTVLLIGAYQGPLFSALQVVPHAVTPYVTMFCAVGSCLNKGLYLSDESMEKLESVMPVEDWARYYSRFKGHDLYMFEREEGMDLTGFSAGEAFSLYLEALFRYPGVVIKDRLDGANLLWDVTMPDESFLAKTFDFVEIAESAGLEIEGYEDGEVYINYSSIASGYRRLREFSFPGEREIDQISNVLLWRTGIYLLFFMTLTIFWHKNALNRLWWAAMPLVGNTAGLMLVLYHQSYRYVFYLQLLTLTLTLATFAFIRQEQDASILNTEGNGEWITGSQF